MPKKKYVQSKENNKIAVKGLEKAIEIVGGVGNLAKIMGVTRQTIYFWRWKKQVIPVERALQLEKTLKGQVKIEDLRPELFD
jgi:DNA-binding transcriptional regulator YdaS (Cro superfamily)